MQLYLVEKDVNVADYGEVRAAVVIAPNLEQARAVLSDAEKDPARKYSWFHPSEVTVKKIGTAAKGQEAGIVLVECVPSE